MLKKWLSIITLACSLAVSACWIDGGQIILPGAQTQIRIDGKVVSGRMTVALPATVEILLVRFSPGRPINRVMLQYRSSGSEEWATLYDTSRIPYENEFLPIFGTETLKSKMFPNAEAIQIRVYVGDGFSQTFDPEDATAGIIILQISPNRRPSYE